MTTADRDWRRTAWIQAAVITLCVLVSGCGEQDNSTPTRLTDNTATENYPVWSPDGQKIAYEAYERSGGHGSEIYVIDADGSNQTRLTTNSADDNSPVWSPNGEKIAFVSDRDDKAGIATEIYMMDVDGSNQSRLTTSRSNYDPLWSPNGQNIAFLSDRDGNREIYVMDEDGETQTNLTYSFVLDDNFTWSSDSQKFAFTRSWAVDGDCGGCVGETEIYVMDANGSHQTRLTIDTADDDDGLPVWSPDGQKIAYESWRNGSTQVYVMDADGSHETRLTADGADDWKPVWSPEGEKIAFIKDQATNSEYLTEIYTVNVDGRN